MHHSLCNCLPCKEDRLKNKEGYLLVVEEVDRSLFESVVSGEARLLDDLICHCPVSAYVFVETTRRIREASTRAVNSFELGSDTM